MNAEEIIKVINELCNKFGVAIDWTSQNVMPYLQELMGRIVKYKIIGTSIGLGIGILMILFAIIFSIVLIQSYRYSRNLDKDTVFFESYGTGAVPDPNMVGAVAIAISIICLIFGGIITALSIDEIIKWVFVPELGLYEYITSLAS
jgi:hypothetical protein